LSGRPRPPWSRLPTPTRSSASCSTRRPADRHQRCCGSPHQNVGHTIVPEKLLPPCIPTPCGGGGASAAAGLRRCCAGPRSRRALPAQRAAPRCSQTTPQWCQACRGPFRCRCCWATPSTGIHRCVCVQESTGVSWRVRHSHTGLARLCRRDAPHMLAITHQPAHMLTAALRCLCTLSGLHHLSMLARGRHQPCMTPTHAPPRARPALHTPPANKRS
jgi:hypothetical protein